MTTIAIAMNGIIGSASVIEGTSHVRDVASRKDAPTRRPRRQTQDPTDDPLLSNIAVA
jgi:hypothetical protein